MGGVTKSISCIFAVLAVLAIALSIANLVYSVKIRRYYKDNRRNIGFLKEQSLLWN